MEKIDLHIHTNVSDGTLSPKELVQYSIDKDCKKIAITDHDAIRDYSNLEKEYGLEVISGIEFNSSIKNMHILGYGIKDISELSRIMDELRRKNEEVCYRVIDMMQRAGYDISLTKIINFLKENNLSTDIIDKRKIVKYLIYKGYAKNVKDAYDSLIGANQKFYVPNHKITPKEIIDLVNETGGISVWAHPHSVTISPIQIYTYAKELKDFGLTGIEIYNRRMNNETNSLIDIANSLDLIHTVGSDFHNPKSDQFGVDVDERIYESFQEKIGKSR